MDELPLGMHSSECPQNHFGDVLDPFKVKRGWFQLELVGFKVTISKNLDANTRAKVRQAIKRLGLDDFRTERQKDAQKYWSRDVSLRTLREESPFVAEELRRQGRLNTGDVW
jgi:hypothetical protein